MKAITANIILGILSNTAFSQSIPWEFKYGPKTDSGIGNERCRQELIKDRDPYAFQTWPALNVPNNQPQSWQPQPNCDVRQTNSKEWERRDQECVKHKDKKAKESCYDRLDKDKKSDKSRAESCLKEKERLCQNIQDSRSRDDCSKRLNAERKGKDPLAPQSPQLGYPQKSCCLRLYGDRNCKQKVFEICNPGQGYAQSDVPSWNVVCA